jgi:hypothetical protein
MRLYGVYLDVVVTVPLRTLMDERARALGRWPSGAAHGFSRLALEHSHPP